MKRCMSVWAASVLLSLSVLPAPVLAQGINPQCGAGLAQDACQKAIDVFNFLAPQLGVAVAGGNATIGVGGTVGGLGHIYVSGRANILQADVPQVDQVPVSINGATSSRYATNRQTIGIPEADASIGIFRGLPLGITNVGGLDLLVSASYLPAFTAGAVNVRVPNGSFNFGAGARLGLIQETPLLPGIAVTYLRRGLPTMDVVAHSGSDTLRVSGVGVTTDAARLVVSKSLFAFGIAAGVGQDHYDSRATAYAYVAPRSVIPPPGFGSSGTGSATEGPVALHQSLTRTTYFVDGSLNLPFVRLIGEIGRTSASTVATYNTFDSGPAGAARTYGALGVRLGL